MESLVKALKLANQKGSGTVHRATIVGLEAVAQELSQIIAR
jgi:hypothetical protein